MEAFLDENVAGIFNSYPVRIRKKLLNLRSLIFQIAVQLEDSPSVTETIKWGQPSYICKYGSTIRIDSINPNHYAMYFHCQTKLVDTFRLLFGDALRYEGNRAILFSINEDPPLNILKQCIELGLTYHKRKHLPLLGM